MDSLLAPLERRFGRFAIPNLPLVLGYGTGAVFVLSLVQPGLLELFYLDPALVLRGQLWRLITHLFLPISSGQGAWSFLTVFSILVTLSFGRGLEARWGAFKLNVYLLLCAVGTTVTGMVLGGVVGSFYLDATILFAFATLEPDAELQLFFVLPTPVKFIALATGGFFVYMAVIGGLAVRITIAVATANYFLFFGGQLLGLLRGTRSRAAQAIRREALRHDRDDAKEELAGAKTCALCGAREEDGADIRVCTCEKCVPKRSLCLEHARAH